MRRRFLSSVVILLLGAAMGQAQTPALPANADAADDSGRLWFDASYLLMWFKKSPEPVPLVTSASLADALPGALGQSGTRVLLGGSPIDTGEHSGARFLAGYWLNPERTLGVEAGYFFLAERGVQQTISTSGLPGSPNLAVPYFDVTGAAGLNGVPGESIYVVPGPFGSIPAFAGTITRTLTSRLQGAESNVVGNVYQGNGLRLDGLAGCRWLELREDLTLSVETLGLPGTAGVAGQFYNTLDSFGARNDFYGGQLGAQAEYQAGPWLLRVRTMVALGDMHETADVNGAGQTSNGNLFFSTGGLVKQPFPGGIITQPSNIGQHVRDRFTVVPEETVSVGFQPWEWLRVFVSYNFLYIGSVSRPGDLIDRDINATRTGLADAIRSVGLGTPATGPLQPSFSFHDSNFWAQGISFGAEFRY